MQNNKNITIKIVGERSQILEVLQLLEPLFPFYHEGNLLENNDDDKFHVFVTVALPIKEAVHA